MLQWSSMKRPNPFTGFRGGLDLMKSSMSSWPFLFTIVGMSPSTWVLKETQHWMKFCVCNHTVIQQAVITPLAYHLIKLLWQTCLSIQTCSSHSLTFELCFGIYHILKKRNLQKLRVWAHTLNLHTSRSQSLRAGQLWPPRVWTFLEERAYSDSKVSKSRSTRV